MLGSAGEGVAVLIFMIHYHLGDDGVVVGLVGVLSLSFVSDWI
eukprot:SAG25_NODE_286_length_10355_cov_16.654544_6_plen_43_part_00